MSDHVQRNGEILDFFALLVSFMNESIYFDHRSYDFFFYE